MQVPGPESVRPRDPLDAGQAPSRGGSPSSPTEIVTRCPGCLGDDLHEAFPPDLSRCHGCGLHFRNPRPTEAAVLRHYAEGLTFDRWQGERDARRPLWQKRLDLLRRFRPAGALLDVGTGDGFFLELAGGSFTVSSTEPSDGGCRYLRARGLPHAQGTLDEIDFGERRFDVITLWHVLEHLHEPARALDRIHRLLAPEGILAVAVPNETLPLWRARLGRRRRSPFGPFRPGDEIHLVHFVPSVLRALLARHGFEVLELGVDDVHVTRSWRSLLSYHGNVVLNAAAGWHVDAAMYAICARREPWP